MSAEARGDELEGPASAMRERWDRLAKRNARRFIATGRSDWDPDEFFASGAELARSTLEWVGPEAGRERALDLGCGLGRVSVHLAAAFERVDALDISPEMIERARELSAPPGLHFSVGSGSDLSGFEAGSFDLVFSYIVFQHVASDSVLASYLREVARVLRPRGRGVVQFDSRPSSRLQRLGHGLPDALLPATRRRHIRRYRRHAGTLHEMLAAAGLTVLDERGRGSEEHFVLVRAA